MYVRELEQQSSTLVSKTVCSKNALSIHDKDLKLNVS